MQMNDYIHQLNKIKNCGFTWLLAPVVGRLAGPRDHRWEGDDGRPLPSNRSVLKSAATFVLSVCLVVNS